MEYKVIENDFIERTIKILSEYDGEYEVTLLLNACLGLIVVPKEHHLRKIDDLEIGESESLWGLSRTDVKFGSQGENYKLKYIVKRLRNGIAHFRIKDSSSNNEITKVSIKDIYPGKKQDYLEVTFSIEALKTFALKLANSATKA